MRKLILALCFFTFHVELIAQQKTFILSSDEGEKIEMDLVTNPEDVSSFYAGIDLNLEVLSLSFNPGLTVSYKPSSSFHLNLNGVLPFNFLAMSMGEEEEFADFKKYTHGELIANYYFIDNNKAKKKRFFFGNKLGRVVTSYYANLEIPRKVKYGIRAGYQYMVLPIRLHADQNDYANNKFPQVFESHTAVLGIGKTSAIQYTATTKDFGSVGEQRFGQFYLDALMVLQGNTMYSPESDLWDDGYYFEEESKLGGLGFRLGYNLIRAVTSGTYARRYGIEVGVLPGTSRKGAGGYFAFKVGFGLVSKQ